MKEIETRILDIDVDFIRKTILQAGGQKVKEENQVNKIFDYPDRRLLRKKGYARIRIVEDLLNKKEFCYMTTKKMISQEKYKIMEENEVLVDNGPMAENIFYSLGLELVQTIEKYRESYKYKNSLVEIDINDKNFCPFPYIEIETEKEDELIEIVKLLGYKMSDTSSKSLFQILKERGITPKL